MLGYEIEVYIGRGTVCVMVRVMVLFLLCVECVRRADCWLGGFGFCQKYLGRHTRGFHIKNKNCGMRVVCVRSLLFSSLYCMH